MPTITKSRRDSVLAAVLCLLFAAGTLYSYCSPQAGYLRQQEDLERRMDKGDLSAIWVLYQTGTFRTEEARAYIALQGAVWGDWDFQRIHFEFWLRTRAKEKRAEDISYLRRDLRGPQLTCYLTMLESERLSPKCLAARRR